MAEEPKPDILSEEAKKIKVPSWWKGPTTMTDASMVVATMEKARNPS